MLLCKNKDTISLGTCQGYGRYFAEKEARIKRFMDWKKRVYRMSEDTFKKFRDEQLPMHNFGKSGFYKWSDWWLKHTRNQIMFTNSWLNNGKSK